MKVAINTRFLLTSKMEGFGWYTFEIAKRLVENHPEHTFYFFFDRTYDDRFIFGDNVVPVVINPPARHPILFKIWFDWSVKRALKKYNVDLFFSPDGYLSLTSSVPQIGTIHDINFEHYPEDIPSSARKYLRKYFPKFAQKAKHIITVSEFSKQDICSTYSVSEEKVTAIWNGANDQFSPLDSHHIQEVRNNYAQGKEYYLFVGSLHPRKNIRRLIEAYNQLVQQNKTSYDLIIVGTSLWKDELNFNNLGEDVQSRIHFTGHLSLEDLTKVMGAASIFTFVPYFEGFGIPLVEAMKSGVPIVAGNKSCLPEVAGEAALYCDPFDVSSIANTMSQLEHDESLQKQLIQAGLERSKLFSWDTAAKEVAKVIGL